MEENKKPKIKRVHILLAVLIALLVPIIVGGIEVYKEDRAQRERFLNGEYREYHNQPHNVFGAPIVYFRSDLERIVGVRLREKDIEIEGYKCKKYWNNRNTPTRFDDLTFYIFDSERQANKALEKIKKNSFYEINDEGGNYVRGWLEGVVDADIEKYYYVNGNLMVDTTVTAVDESARSVDDSTPGVWGGGQEALTKIRMINENF